MLQVGKSVLSGTAAALAQDPQVQKAYLGRVTEERPKWRGIFRHCEEPWRRSDPCYPLCRDMDYFAEPVIGRASREPVARNDD